MYDYIRIPWCHLLFSTEALVNAAKTMKPVPRHGKLSAIEHFLELNRITVPEFKRAISSLNFTIVNFELRMIRNLRPLKYVPLLNKYLIARAVALLSK